MDQSNKPTSAMIESIGYWASMLNDEAKKELLTMEWPCEYMDRAFFVVRGAGIRLTSARKYRQLPKQGDRQL